MQVLRFIGAVLGGEEEREAFCQEPAELHMLWQVLRLLCQHKGDLRSPEAAGAAVERKRPGQWTWHALQRKMKQTQRKSLSK